MLWYKSQKFKAYVLSEATVLIGWLTECLTKYGWHFHQWLAGTTAVAISTLALVLLILKDWASTDVVAPFAVMNRGNVSTVPASSVAAAMRESGEKP